MLWGGGGGFLILNKENKEKQNHKTNSMHSEPKNTLIRQVWGQTQHARD